MIRWAKSLRSRLEEARTFERDESFFFSFANSLTGIKHTCLTTELTVMGSNCQTMNPSVFIFNLRSIGKK